MMLPTSKAGVMTVAPEASPMAMPSMEASITTMEASVVMMVIIR